MNFIDILIGCFLCMFLYQGFKKGMIREVAIIAGSFIGFYAGIAFYEDLAVILQEIVPGWSEKILALASFLIILFIIFFIAGFFGKYLKDSIKIEFLKSFDGMLGGVFGLIKGVVIVSIVFIGIQNFLSVDIPMINESKISQIIIDVTEEMVPQDFIKDKISGVKENWEE
ncbi:MAG: CvpA family protein [Desulfobacterales bacterium]|nr:CvpA family protein [Desulfobacterales bacterium]MCP4159969.1 CvpA family protein [Deltaproteobacteria bacterium]